MATVAASPISGPAPTPIIGGLGNAYKYLRDPVTYIAELYKHHGRLALVVAGDQRHIIAIGPEYNRLVLSDAQLFHTIFEHITPDRVKARRRGIGLLNMNGEQHKQQRRLMMPAFHRKQVEGYHQTMVAFTQNVLDQWSPEQQIDIAEQMSQLTLRIACQTLFGLDVTDRAQAIGQLVNRFLAANPFAPQVMLFPFDLPGTPYRRMFAAADALDDEILALIQRKRATPSEQHDVLATLIHARDENGGGMTDLELIGQATTLLIAGHETSANALAWTLFLLSQHPQVHADVVDELTGVLDGNAPTIEHIGRLPLLERVIKESMRLLPPAALVTRISTGPFEIGGHQRPEGTMVTVSQYATHRLPELYQEPQRFNPQRWETIDPSPYEYMPFGAGPRMCIGATFAMMEIKIVLAMLLQRFRLDTVANAQIDHQFRITLSPKGGIPMVVAQQDRQFVKVPVRGNIHKMIDLN